MRHRGPEGEEKRKREYRELLHVTRQILGDARRVLEEVEGLPRRRRTAARGLGEHLKTMADRVRSVVRQTKARIFGGLTKLPDKIVSLFEPHTEIIRKGKAGKPNEFGKLVQLQEAENRSSRIMRCTTIGRQTSGCSFRPWRRMHANWVAYPGCWQRMRATTREPMKKP